MNDNHDGVSNIIGVVLIVLITIILSGVIGGVIFGLVSVEEPAPNIAGSEATLDLNDSGNVHTLTYQMTHGEDFYWSSVNVLVQSDEGRMQLRQLPLRNGDLTDTNVGVDSGQWNVTGSDVVSGQITEQKMTQSNSFSILINSSDVDSEFTNGEICFVQTNTQSLFGCTTIEIDRV